MGGEQHGNMEAVGYDMYLKLLSDAVNEQNGVEVELITDVGPVIGAHSGPGTLALFFVGRTR